MRRRTALGVALVLFASVGTAGCGDNGTDLPPPPPEVSGSWSGTSQGVTMNLTLVQGAGGAVSASGNIAGPNDTSQPS